MSDINRVTLIGNIGQDPEFKYFESGAVITSFSIAVNRYDSKTKEDISDWFYVKTFSKLGEHLTKGLRVAVDGRLQTDSWEKDGVKKKTTYVFADSVQILTPKEGIEDRKSVV